MKNIKILRTKDEVDKYVYNLWQTDEFRAAHKDPNSWVNTIVSYFTMHPRFFADMSEDSIEYSHFYSWMNVITHRYHYTNPYLHDLYYLHEISHCSTMKWDGKIDFYVWAEKMHANEFMSALSSEVFIYFFMKKEGRDIRSKTFDHEIWADRFKYDADKWKWLTPSHIWRHWYDPCIGSVNLTNYSVRYNIPQPAQEIVARRKVAIQGFGVDKEKDFVEFQVSRYAHQNYLWSEVWRENYRKIETNMCEFMYICNNQSDKRDQALDTYLEFLTNNSTGGIPFRLEAMIFADIAKQGNKIYGNLLLLGNNFTKIKEKITQDYHSDEMGDGYSKYGTII